MSNLPARRRAQAMLSPPSARRTPLRPVGWSRKCAANVKIRSTSLWHSESVPAIVKSASVSEAIHERA